MLHRSIIRPDFCDVTGRTAGIHVAAHATPLRWIPAIPGVVALEYEENPRC
jgi:hypothetical protein